MSRWISVFLQKSLLFTADPAESTGNQHGKIQRIIGFTAGEFTLTSLGEDIRMDISLYTEDSTRYHAIYQGSAHYR